MDYSEGIFTESNSYQICLQNNLEELDKLTIWLNKIAEFLDFSSQTLFRLDLVLSEIVTNIIENAYGDEQAHPIVVHIQNKEDKIFLTVEDEGREFNPFEQPEFQGFANLESAQIGGLGIHFIRSFSDEYSYQRQEQKNQITVVFISDRDKEDDQ